MFKLLGIFVSFAVIVSGIYLTPISAASANDLIPDRENPASLSDVELDAEPVLSSLVLKSEKINSKIYEVTLESNVTSVPSESPISIVDSESFDIIKVCSVVSDCSVEVKIKDHPIIYAQQNDVRSEPLVLGEVDVVPIVEDKEAVIEDVQKVEPISAVLPTVEENVIPEEYVGVDSVLRSSNSETEIGVDIEIDNPVFSNLQRFGLSATANTVLWNKNLGVYIVELKTGTILANQTWTPNTGYSGSFTDDPSRDYQAYVADWNYNATNVSELTNIVAESGIVTAYRAPWTVDLYIEPDVFYTGQHAGAVATANQNVSNSSYAIYLFDITNDIMLGRNSYSGSQVVANVNFSTGGVRSYKAYVALNDTTVQKVEDLTGIQAESEIHTAQRLPWTVELELSHDVFEESETPGAVATANQNVSNSSYAIYLFDVTNDIMLGRNSYNGTQIFHNISFYTGGSRSYKAYVALNDTTVQKIEDLTDIQAESETKSISRASWSLNIYDSCCDWLIAPGYYRTNIGFNTNQGVPRDYTFVWKNITDGYWSSGKPDAYGGWDDISIPLGEYKMYVAYIGYPVRDPNNYWSIIGVSDVQAVSNVALFGAPSNGYEYDSRGYKFNDEVAGGYNPSENCAQACEADPINVVTGEFFENNTDVSLPNVGLPLEFVRSYGSMSKDKNDHGLGYGWTSNFDMKVQDFSDTPAQYLWDATEIEVVQENGSTIPFYRAPDDSFMTLDRVNATLEYSSDSDTYTLVRKDGSRFIFSSVDGRLLKKEDSSGNKILLSYDSLNRIKKLSADNGKFIEITWSSGKIVKVEDSAGYFVNYEYDSNDNLLSVEDDISVIKSYTYDNNHQVMSMSDAEGGTVVNEYSYGQVVKQIDENGGETTFEYYGPVGRTHLITHAVIITYPNGLRKYQEYENGSLVRDTQNYETNDELVWSYTYDKSRNLKKTVNPDGSTITANFDAEGNILSSKDEMGVITTYGGYNVHHAPTSVINGEGKESTFGYNSNGVLTSVTDPEGKTTLVVPNANGTTSKVVSESGDEINYVYDSENNVKSIENELEEKTTYFYNPSGQIVKTVDDMGRELKETYDIRGNVLTSEDADGNVTVFEYDDNSRLVKTVDALNNETTKSYDAAGNVLTSTDEMGNVTSYTYTGLNDVETITDSLNNVIEYEYDIFNNLVLIRDGEGNESHFEYDWKGNVTREISPLGKVTEKVYNYGGKVIESYDPDGNKTSFTYNALGAVTSITDPANQITSFVYNDNNKLISKTRPDGLVETVTYDDNDQRSTFTDTAGNVSHYVYDDKKQLISNTTLGVVSMFDYDAAGNIVKKTNPADNSFIEYTYDDRNLLTHVEYSDNTPDVSYSYDVLGRKVSMVDGSGTTTYDYDDLSRIVKVSHTIDGDIGYEYNANNMVSMVYPSGEVIDYGYDKNNQLVTVDSVSVGEFVYQYDEDKNLVKTLSPNGVETDYMYSTNNNLSQINHSKNSSNLLTFDYLYNNLSLMTTKNVTDDTNAVSLNDYGYDSLMRLSTLGGNNVFSFDALHNVLTKNNGDVLTYSSPTSQVTDFDNSAANKHVDYGYDVRGNRVNAQTLINNISVGNDTYEYNVANQLVEANLAANPPPNSTTDTIKYSYDGNGLRVKKVSNYESFVTVEENFIWDTNTEVPTLLEDENKEYIYGLNSTPIAQIDKDDDTVHYLYADNIGSISLVTDVNGIKVAQYGYDEYGQQVSGEQNHVTTKFSFAGEYIDTDTGFLYLRARWYDPQTAQFTSVDPKLITTHLSYGYTAGNPLLYTDPLGLDWMLDATQSATDFVYGAWDVVTVGLASSFVNSIAPNSVDVCSTAYSIGEHAGMAIGLASGNPSSAMLFMSKKALTNALKVSTFKQTTSVVKKTDSLPLLGPERLTTEIARKSIMEARTKVGMEGDAIIYLRTHPITSKIYVGKANSYKNYLQREAAHNKKLKKYENHGLDYNIKIIAKTDINNIRRAEEFLIRAGGGKGNFGKNLGVGSNPKNPNGVLENKIAGMNNNAYIFQGGDF